MGQFDEYITGKLELKVNNKALLLDARLEDKRVLKACIGEKATTQDKIDALKIVDEQLIKILKRSYPDEKPEAMEAYYETDGDELFSKLLIKFGWITEDKTEELKN